MRKLYSAAAALALASVPGLVQAQASAACVSRAEANALFANTLPDVLEGVRNKCASSLPANAFLTTQGPALVARYRASASGDWALARSGFVKMMGSKGETEDKLVAALPDQALQGLLTTAFSVVVANDIKVKDCPDIDRFVAALSPLPAANVAEIVTGLISMGGSGKSEPFQICRGG
jgi:hypothetical protein